MNAFARGFTMGSDIYQRGLDNKRRKEKDAMESEAHKSLMETRGLQNDALRREATTQAELRGLRTEMSDFLTGTDRQATNANLDADFERAVQATGLGLPAPAMVGGSNMENQQALTVRRPVDMASPEFQSGMAGLRSRYALASGNMADFDAVTTAERTRITNAQDAEYAQAVIADPNGEQALQARTFINDQSKSLAIKPPGKDGMSIIEIVRGPNPKEIKVPPADLAKIAVGVRRLQRGDVGGLDVIAGVNKELAAAAAAEFNLDLKVAEMNNDATYKQGSLDNDRERTAIARESLGIQRGLANQNRPPRELKPETVAALNDLRDKISQEPDPAKRRQLENDWNRMYSMASTELGRVVMPRSQAEVGPLDKERLTAYFKALESLGPKTPQGQVDALAARFGVTHLLNGDAAGGLPGWGDKPPAPEPEKTSGASRLPPDYIPFRPLGALNDWRRSVVERSNRETEALGLNLSGR